MLGASSGATLTPGRVVVTDFAGLLTDDDALRWDAVTSTLDVGEASGATGVVRFGNLLSTFTTSIRAGVATEDADYTLPTSLPPTAGRAMLFDLLGAGSWSQPLLTSSPVQFLRLGVNAPADPIIPLYVSSGIVGIGGNTNAKMTTGVHIDQTTSDDLAFAIASTGDFAHGITDIAPTGVYAAIVKNHPTSGGMRLYGFGTTIGAYIYGLGTTDNTTKTTAGTGYVSTYGGKKSGTSYGAPGANANVFAVNVAGAGAVHLVDKEGKLHINETSTDTFPTIDMKQSSTGDVGIRFGCGATTSAMAGLDNSLTGDPLVIAFANSATAVLGTGDVFHLTSAGSLGIGLGNSVAPATRLDIGAGAMTLKEMTAPGAGAADTVRVYAEANGSGKTRLMAQFGSGSAVQLAIEP